MKRSDELKREISDLVDQAESINSRASRGNDGDPRALTPDEQDTWDSIMAKDTGKLAVLQTKLEKAVDDESQTARLRSARVSTHNSGPDSFDSSGGRRSQVDQSERLGSFAGGRVNLIMPKLQAFHGGGNRLQASRDAYDCGLYLLGRLRGDTAAMQMLESRRGSEWYATQNENNPTAGGYLCPAPLAEAIMVSRQEVGAMRKLSRIVPMPSDTFAYPKQSAGTTVYYPGEENSITPSDLDFGRANLVAKKRAIYSLVSNELKDDSIVPIVDLLATDMGHQLALKEDQEGVAGDGTSTYGGVHGIRPKLIAATASIATAATGHDTWPELDYGDLAAVMGKLPARFRTGNNLKWLCSPAFKWAVMDRLAIAQGGAPSQTIVDGIPQDRFLGYPVVLSDEMPTTAAAATVCAAFGNFDRAVLLGDRNEVRVAISEHIAFQTDQTAVRSTVRYDINVHEAGDTTSAGAIVALATAS